MKDLNSIFINAKNKKTFHNYDEIDELIKDILQSDKTICIDCDKGAGEEWVRLFRQGTGIMCMLHRKIGIAFVRLLESDITIKKVLNTIYVVEVEDYNLEEWRIDLNILHECTPEITWNVSPYAVDTENMSLNDLYFATV
jgi:hypothetical protein